MTRPYPHSDRCPRRLAVLDIETLAPPMPGDALAPWPLLDPIAGTVLSATMERYGQWQFALESVDFVADEAAAVERVSQLIEGRALVTFDGRRNLPMLALRAMKHHRFDANGISSAWQANRFRGLHRDLANMVSSFGAGQGTTLQRLCALLGIPCKLGRRGSDVAELVAKREFEAIERSCETMAAATLCVFAYAEGFRTNDPGYAATLISQFSRWVADCQPAHLKAFKRIEGCDELDRLSLTGVLDQGISSLEHRQHLRFVTNVPGQTGVFNQTSSDF